MSLLLDGLSKVVAGLSILVLAIGLLVGEEGTVYAELSASLHRAVRKCPDPTGLCKVPVEHCPTAVCNTTMDCSCGISSLNECQCQREV
jgi:hypothetical protein